MYKTPLKFNWAITNVIAITCIITQGQAETNTPTVELLPNEVTISSNVKTIVGEKYGFTPYTARIPTQAYPRYKTEHVTIQEELKTATSIPQTTWEQITATTLPNGYQITYQNNQTENKNTQYAVTRNYVPTGSLTDTNAWNTTTITYSNFSASQTYEKTNNIKRSGQWNKSGLTESFKELTTTINNNQTTNITLTETNGNFVQNITNSSETTNFIVPSTGNYEYYTNLDITPNVVTPGTTKTNTTTTPTNTTTFATNTLFVEGATTNFALKVPQINTNGTLKTILGNEPTINYTATINPYIGPNTEHGTAISINTGTTQKNYTQNFQLSNEFTTTELLTKLQAQLDTQTGINTETIGQTPNAYKEDRNLQTEESLEIKTISNIKYRFVPTYDNKVNFNVKWITTEQSLNTNIKTITTIKQTTEQINNPIKNSWIENTPIDNKIMAADVTLGKSRKISIAPDVTDYNPQNGITIDENLNAIKSNYRYLILNVENSNDTGTITNNNKTLQTNNTNTVIGNFNKGTDNLNIAVTNSLIDNTTATEKGQTLNVPGYQNIQSTRGEIQLKTKTNTNDGNSFRYWTLDYNNDGVNDEYIYAQPEINLYIPNNTTTTPTKITAHYQTSADLLIVNQSLPTDTNVTLKVYGGTTLQGKYIWRGWPSAAPTTTDTTTIITPPAGEYTITVFNEGNGESHTATYTLKIAGAKPPTPINSNVRNYIENFVNTLNYGDTQQLNLTIAVDNSNVLKYRIVGGAALNVTEDTLTAINIGDSYLEFYSDDTETNAGISIIKPINVKKRNIAVGLTNLTQNGIKTPKEYDNSKNIPKYQLSYNPNELAAWDIISLTNPQLKSTLPGNYGIADLNTNTKINMQGTYGDTTDYYTITNQPVGTNDNTFQIVKKQITLQINAINLLNTTNTTPQLTGTLTGFLGTETPLTVVSSENETTVRTEIPASIQLKNNVSYTITSNNTETNFSITPHFVTGNIPNNPPTGTQYEITDNTQNKSTLTSNAYDLNVTPNQITIVDNPPVNTWDTLPDNTKIYTNNDYLNIGVSTTSANNNLVELKLELQRNNNWELLTKIQATDSATKTKLTIPTQFIKFVNVNETLQFRATATDTNGSTTTLLTPTYSSGNQPPSILLSCDSATEQTAITVNKDTILTFTTIASDQETNLTSHRLFFDGSRNLAPELPATTTDLISTPTSKVSTKSASFKFLNTTALPITYTLNSDTSDGTETNTANPITITVNPAENAASNFIGENIDTTQIQFSNSTTSFTQTWKNTGNTTWDSSNTEIVVIAPSLESNLWGKPVIGHIATGVTIAPGEQKDIEIIINTPANPGVYEFQTKLRNPQTKVYFGDNSTKINIQVERPQSLLFGPPPTVVFTNNTDVIAYLDVTADQTTDYTRIQEIYLERYNSDLGQWENLKSIKYNPIPTTNETIHIDSGNLSLGNGRNIKIRARAVDNTFRSSGWKYLTFITNLKNTLTITTSASKIRWSSDGVPQVTISWSAPNANYVQIRGPGFNEVVTEFAATNPITDENANTPPTETLTTTTEGNLETLPPIGERIVYFDTTGSYTWTGNAFVGPLPETPMTQTTEPKQTSTEPNP
jgi:hypothetical protein